MIPPKVSLKWNDPPPTDSVPKVEVNDQAGVRAVVVGELGGRAGVVRGVGRELLAVAKYGDGQVFAAAEFDLEAADLGSARRRVSIFRNLVPRILGEKRPRKDTSELTCRSARPE